MENMEIRKLAMENGVRLWEVAEMMGIAEGTLSRKLRKRLPKEEKSTIVGIIKGIANARK